MSKLPVREKARRKKFCYVGAPAIFKLEQCCWQLNSAWWWGDESFGCYLVGSSLERPDFRDVDIRMILADDAFRREFPDVVSLDNASWEHDPKWLVMTVAVAEWIRSQAGLTVPVDFQFHPQSFANKRHDGPRHPLGLHYASPRRSRGT